MTLVCIRHLSTQWNEQRVLQGRCDTDIIQPDERCLRAIRHNRARLDSYGSFDRVLVSSLKRTKQTAALYDVHDAAVEPLLDELDFGAYAGQPKAVMLKDCGDAWERDPRNLIFGESMANFDGRIRAFVAQYGHSKTLVFGHGGWMRGLSSIIAHGDLREMNRIRVENNRLYEFKVARPGKL